VTRQSIRWAYGVTAVRSRKDDLLPRTLESLANAGFNRPRLFIDGDNDRHDYDRFGLEVTMRYPTIRTFGNWLLTLWELYLRDPAADRYAIFQDDFVTYKNLRLYLDHCPYPDKGYWNLYTFPQNESRVPLTQMGWFKSNQKGRGAVALIFDRQGIIELLSHRELVERPQNVRRGHRAVDGAVVTVLRKRDYFEWVHNPSLVQHTGEVSSMGNAKHKLSKTFRGEDFDCLDLVETE